ncbi:MAG: type IV toxin-antitoxin system AbiEi family antitoxin domain-containing protein [Planctomycetaceae bacterium]|jgi:hypothetical protein|nr:type IV toxin-antitoxin system AbiEi family antitoxin domain-containing protein [Planctomycetaceae bacterium]
MSIVQANIIDHIRRRGRGKVYTSKDLLRFGSRAAIDQALPRLVKAGQLQRLGRGLYYYPKNNRRLGMTVGPDADEIGPLAGRSCNRYSVRCRAVPCPIP